MLEDAGALRPLILNGGMADSDRADTLLLPTASASRRAVPASRRPAASLRSIFRRRIPQHLQGQQVRPVDSVHLAKVTARRIALKVR